MGNKSYPVDADRVNFEEEPFGQSQRKGSCMMRDYHIRFYRRGMALNLT
jgi:hypothetical protein